jgi:hypothetical protein
MPALLEHASASFDQAVEKNKTRKTQQGLVRCVLFAEGSVPHAAAEKLDTDLADAMLANAASVQAFMREVSRAGMLEATIAGLREDFSSRAGGGAGAGGGGGGTDGSDTALGVAAMAALLGGGADAYQRDR